MARPTLSPITGDDLVRVGAFLNEHLNRRLTPQQWTTATRPPWPSSAPNHGFMLVDDRHVIGVQLAFYANREIDGRLEPFCNLGAWCVLPEHRFHSTRLLTALLGQPGFHFTDLSPSGNVIRLNERLKFQHLDTTTALMLNLPRFMAERSTKVHSDCKAIEERLSSAERAIYADHKMAPASYHAVICSKDEHCYVLFRRDRRKSLPLFASILHVSNPAMFRRAAPAFASHLLTTYGIPATLVEIRTARGRPDGSLVVRPGRPKMFRSRNLLPSQIDNLYSELVCVGW